jgi:hypothetical protein
LLDKEGTMAFARRSSTTTMIATAASAIALTASPLAAANVAGCLPLNGTQLTASSHEDTNYLGPITVTVCNQ